MITQPIYAQTRNYLEEWQRALKQNPFVLDKNFQHSVKKYLPDPTLTDALNKFGAQVVNDLEPLVAENNYRFNWPRLEKYNGIGKDVEQIVHHPSYIAAGNIIYGSRMLERLAKPGGLLESLTFFFLSGHAGEAGHNCPFACSAGIIRALQKITNIPEAKSYIKKLCIPSFSKNFTGAQFLTEIQGGSDVGQNATRAFQDEQGNFRIQGEKWFCSNANADLILMTARYIDKPGTQGLALFLVPKYINAKTHNAYSIRRLKEKIGTCSMASGEIDFHNALAFPVGPLEEGFKLVMENVLHISRLCNTFCMLGMARRAYTVARSYTQHRIAFGQPIFNYPLVKENLATIKAESDAMLAAIFETTHLQDKVDLAQNVFPETKLLLRLLANLNKYISARLSVEHIHHALDMLAGNGAIETFSPMPRLLRDSIVCENWEGTHNTLRIQILRDMNKFGIENLLFQHIETLVAPIQDQTRKTQIETALTHLKTQCVEFKKSSSDLQSLNIRVVVDNFAYLYCAACLLVEAEHQQATTTSSPKLLSFDYFMQLHLMTIPPLFNESYLTLVQKLEPYM